MYCVTWSRGPTPWEVGLFVKSELFVILHRVENLKKFIMFMWLYDTESYF